MDITIPATIITPSHTAQMPPHEELTPFSTTPRMVPGDTITVAGSTVDGTIVLHVDATGLAELRTALAPAPEPAPTPLPQPVAGSNPIAAPPDTTTIS